MIQKNPYCRTCGSVVQSKNVCHYCGCDPAKGHNYCDDCGTTTIAEAIMCVHCGASFQKRFPVVLAVLFSLTVAVAFAGIVFYLNQSGSEATELTSGTTNNDAEEKKIKEEAEPIIKNNNNDAIVSIKKNETGDIIINNIPENLLSKKTDAIQKLVNKLPKIATPEPEVIVISEPRKVNKTITDPVNDMNASAPVRVNMNVFSSREMRNYAVGCSYFTGRSKNNVVFFTTNVYGYVKINGKVYTLQGIHKGNDIARFSGGSYDVTLEIEGLEGNEAEWLAEGSLIVRDSRQRTISRHKIYSTCTDF